MELREEGLHQCATLHAFAKQPNRLGVRHSPFELQPKEAHEGESVANLLFDLVVRQAIQLLQHEHLEHADNVQGARRQLS